MDSPPRSKEEPWKQTLLLSFQSLGVVYGRLSIAPLYVFGTLSSEDMESDEELYGLLSFIFWTMTIIPLMKYACIVLRADDNGEGGTIALYSLLCRHAKVSLLPNNGCSDEVLSYDLERISDTKSKSRARRAIEKHRCSHYLMLFLALFGSCMVIGDGVLNPAISVFSASLDLGRSLSEESNRIFSSPKTQHSVSKALEQYVPVPCACAILIFLFTLQHYGTHKIGSIFAPIIILWLLFISGTGLFNIIHWNRHVMNSLSPVCLYKFIRNGNTGTWKSLGSILLCIAGSEAMFTDLGHFSKKSIKITFVIFIYPALIICYAGQVAFISKNRLSGEIVTRLSQSIPRSIRPIFMVLSLLASAVGSQATITATFSIIKQCVALGCFPRVKVIHTSDKIHGQVYIPDINWVLMILSLAVLIGFRDIVQISNATGLAIIFGMIVTTSLMSLIITLCWEKNMILSACFLIFFGSIEAVYLSACLRDFRRGAWYLVFLLVISMTCMLAWHYGTRKKYEFDSQNKVSIDWLTGITPGLNVSRVAGIGFIYTDIITGIPAFFSHFITNLPACHQVLIFVSSKSLPVPYVLPSRRYLIGRVGPKEWSVYRCIVRYGYCENVRDTNEFEDQLICTIGEFISMEENDSEGLKSPEGRMVVVGSPEQGGNALITIDESSPNTHSTGVAIDGTSRNPLGDILENGGSSVKRKKVRFLLSPESPKMNAAVREELQELVDARESGTAYFLGHSHISVNKGLNIVKQFLIKTYVFLDKNCREPTLALKIPHAALVEVGMVYSI